MKAKEKGSEARHGAAADKRDPDYPDVASNFSFATAKEKFDAMSGDAKGTCVN